MRWAILWGALVFLVALPFILFGEEFARIGDWLTGGAVARPWVAAIVGVLLALDVFLPVPSSLVSVASGALLGFWQGTVVIWIGMTVGCVIAYGIGARTAGAARRFVGDSGLERAGRIVERHGAWALAACRSIPVLAEASVVFAGIVGAPINQFVATTSLSNLGIAVAYAAVGAYAMRRESFILAFLGAIMLPGITLLVGRVWLDRRDRQREGSRV